MAKTLRVNIRTGLIALGNERRIHSDANDVVAGRHDGLSVATVQNEILSSQRETIGVGPTGGNTLVARNADGPTTPELPFARRHATNGNRIRIGIQHAEPTFRCTPNLSGARIDQL